MRHEIRSLQTGVVLLLFGQSLVFCQKPETTVEPAVKEKSKAEEHGMQYRAIGPFRGGRSLTATGIPGDPNTYYFGSTGGGVWKSTDGATTWKPVFDKEGSSSIGSLAVSQSDPNVVYAGTGEACIRGNAAQGDGVYKSLDGGKTWRNMGLRDSRAIGKLIIHPKNPDIVFVAALGHPFGPNPERGIFRTTDGGKNWTRVLYVDENTGAIDIVFDPHNPNILFASMWQVRRTPWNLSSGGPGSGLYRSDDGGTTWKRVEHEGLPKGPYGKIGVAVAANSDRVWALIEAKDGGLYRSDNGGEAWQLINGDHRFLQRAWYYMHVVADPKDANTVYILNVDFHRSTDGGLTFNKIKVPHGDNHGLWIDPLNTRRMIQTDDGGATVTLDGGEHWTRQDNQPTAQFYHVITDNRFPYHVYGAQQDNSTIGISSRGEDGAIDRADWYAVGGGEAGYIAPYPPDPNIVYAGDYQGQITRFDKRNGQTKNITVYPVLTDGGGAANLEHRFQWTAPIVISPHDPNVLYHAGERLFKTTDGGMHWEAISPDLTRNDKSKQQPSGGTITIDDTGTEYYDTIFAVVESPLQKGLIWAGTDDGLVHITRDGGKSWTNVTPKQMPEWSRVSLIEASPHDPGTAYVAAERHQLDDLHPYIYRTADFGGSWTPIASGIPDGSFVRAVREDPKRKGMLFAGTETGVFVSHNDGAQWEALRLNLPATPVHDLVVKGDDLVLATHGRSFWILDDISPLRQQSDAVAKEDVYLYNPQTAYRLHSRSGPKEHLTVGKNPPAGAVIYSFVKSAPKQAQIEILDSKGTVIRKYSSLEMEPLEEPQDPADEKPKKQLEVKPGLNRFVWNLRYEGAPRVADYYLYEYEGGSRGPMALPGAYQARLTVDGKRLTAPLELKPDPRVKTAPQDLEKQFALLLNIRSELARVYGAVNEILDLRAQLAEVRKRAAASDEKELLTACDELDRKLAAVQEPLIQMKIKANEDSLKFGLGLDGPLAGLALAVGSGSDSAPTEAENQTFDQIKGRVDERLLSWTVLRRESIPPFNKLTEQRNAGALVLRSSVGKSH
jgi:photosystem II stability/assembly factor-like uncharacterized protein